MYVHAYVCTYVFMYLRYVQLTHTPFHTGCIFLLALTVYNIRITYLVFTYNPLANNLTFTRQKLAKIGSFFYAPTVLRTRYLPRYERNALRRVIVGRRVLMIWLGRRVQPGEETVRFKWFRVVITDREESPQEGSKESFSRYGKLLATPWLLHKCTSGKEAKKTSRCV